MLTRIFPGWSLEDLNNAPARFLDLAVGFDAMIKDAEAESIARARRR